MSRLVFLTLLLISCAHGAIHHVNNNGDLNNGADFSTLTDAYDAAADNDTLYLYGSAVNYGSITFLKPLTIIGPGYFLAKNPDTQYNQYEAQLATITYNQGSAGSLLTGCKTQKITVYADNVEIRRNHIDYSSSSSSYYAITLSGCTNSRIFNNFIEAENYASAMRLYQCTNSLVMGNIVADSYNYSLRTENAISSLVLNNVFYGSLVAYDCILQNNILATGSFVPNAATTFTHNMSHGTHFGYEDGNQSNVSMSSIFVSQGGDVDHDYILNEGCLAEDAGYPTGDMGAFSGSLPYVLSGMPEGIPSITAFSTPGAGFVLPVHIEAVAH